MKEEWLKLYQTLKLDYSDCKINEVLAFIGNEHVNSSVFLKFDWSTGKIEKIVSGMFLEYEYSHGLNEPRRGGCCDFLKEDKKTLGKLHVMNYGSLNIYKVTLDGYKDKEFIEEFINEWFPLYRYSDQLNFNIYLFLFLKIILEKKKRKEKMEDKTIKAIESELAYQKALVAEKDYNKVAPVSAEILMMSEYMDQCKKRFRI